MALQVADLEDASEESGLVIRQNGEEEVLRVKRMDAKATDQVLTRLLDGLQQHVRSDAEQVVPDLLIDVAVFLLVEKHAVHGRHLRSEERILKAGEPVVNTNQLHKSVSPHRVNRLRADALRLLRRILDGRGVHRIRVCLMKSF